MTPATPPALAPRTRLGADHCLPITMWDFSWLERRWPGAGYEDWGGALDELAERGYEAVRIDAYPHLLAADVNREWELLPEWSTNDWGAPARCRVRPWPALARFVATCHERGLRVGLSTWFRQDVDNVRLRCPSPAAHARLWTRTLDLLAAEGLLDAILYVDLCNEWPMDCWAPFYRPPEGQPRRWRSVHAQQWAAEALAIVRAAFPHVPLTVSHSELEATGLSGPLPYDFLEPHLWMATVSDFNQRLDYTYQRFDLSGYDRLARHAEALYRADAAHWQATLTQAIARHADWSRQTGLPLVTTECWGIVDYKDWPLLDWGWVQELCALGTTRAAATGQWIALATSNFCGPQFRGMWRDVAWHQRLTAAIRRAPVPVAA